MQRALSEGVGTDTGVILAASVLKRRCLRLGTKKRESHREVP